MRGYRITDNKVVLFTLKPFKNHSKTQYFERFEYSFYMKRRIAKMALGVVWKLGAIPERPAGI